MIYSSFNPKVWNTLLYSMVILGLKVKDNDFIKMSNLFDSKQSLIVSK